MTMKGPEDEVYDDVIVRLARVSWSRQRCYHGEKVTISVRTDNVVDGAQLTIRVFTEDLTTTVDEIGGLAIQASAHDHEYEIKWEGKVIPPAARRFVAKAFVEAGPLESAASPPLYVDLEPPAFSV